MTTNEESTTSNEETVNYEHTMPETVANPITGPDFSLEVSTSEDGAVRIIMNHE